MSLEKSRNEDRNNLMVQDYLNGMKDTDIAAKYGLSINTVKPILKSKGVYRYERSAWTEEEVQMLKNNYNNLDWKNLLSLFPSKTKQAIITKASDLNLTRECYFWNENDIQILKDGYASHKSIKEIEKELNYKFPETSILTKARRLNIKKREFWTQNELEIIKDNYSIRTMDEMCELLPGRSKAGIMGQAKKLNVLSKYYLSNPYSDDEENFIAINYKYMTDKEISECIGRTERSVKAKRESLGFFKSAYTPLTDIKHSALKSYLRKHNYQWRKDSINNCNSKCVITGKDFTDVHHIHSFDLILDEFLKEENLMEVDFNNYSEDDLKGIAEKFYKKQNSYPLGVCLSKEIHVKFHSLYGYGKNTISQFNDFKNKIQTKEIKIA